MKFPKYCFAFLLLCVLLADRVRNTEGDVLTEFALSSLPNLASMAGVTFTGPLAPIMVGSLLTLSLASTIIRSENNPKDELTKMDFVESQNKITESIQSINEKITMVSAQLIDVAESHAFFEDMRNDLDLLREAVDFNLKYILNAKTQGVAKKTAMYTMLDYFSDFRHILRSFVSKYIKPKGVIVSTGDVKLFYEFILTKQRNAFDFGDDCDTESVHTKLFKSYMTIVKTLTDGYVMLISAHIVQYQSEIEQEPDSALETERITVKLIEQYESDMQMLTEKTKWALEKASRDVRNCGYLVNSKNGDAFKRVSFAYILPKFRDWDDDKFVSRGKTGLLKQKCFDREEHVKYSDFEISDKCTDGDLGTPADLTVYVDPENYYWPYVYLTNKPTYSPSKTLGNATAISYTLETLDYYTNKKCSTIFCDAFKKKAVGVSMDVADVGEGFVITGARLRIRGGVIFIQVKKGKLLNDLTVDPESVMWVQQDAFNNVVYLDSNIRKFNLGDVETGGNQYLRSIQFVFKNEADGIIGLRVNGETPESSPESGVSINLDLSKSVGPLTLGPGAKNIVTQPPIPSKPFHVSLQASDLERDLGRTTIPFFDIRDVLTDPPSPVVGVGLYHQTVQGSGGYIGLKLKQANLNRFVDFEMIQKTIRSSYNPKEKKLN